MPAPRDRASRPPATPRGGGVSCLRWGASMRGRRAGWGDGRRFSSPIPADLAFRHPPVHRRWIAGRRSDAVCRAGAGGATGGAGAGAEGDAGAGAGGRVWTGPATGCPQKTDGANRCKFSYIGQLGAAAASYPRAAHDSYYDYCIDISNTDKVMLRCPAMPPGEDRSGKILVRLPGDSGGAGGYNSDLPRNARPGAGRIGRSVGWIGWEIGRVA